MNLLVVLAAWSVLSVPAALAFGAVLGARMRSEPQATPATVPVTTQSHRTGS